MIVVANTITLLFALPAMKSISSTKDGLSFALVFSYVIVMFLGLFFLMNLITYLKKSPVVVMNSQGLLDNTFLLSSYFIRWSHIKEVEGYTGRNAILLVRFSYDTNQEGQPKRPKRLIMNRDKNIATLNIQPTYLPLRPNKFADFINNYRQAAARGESIVNAPWLPKEPEIVVKPAAQPKPLT
jgi:hypothetical protein